MKIGLCGLGRAGKEFIRYIDDRKDIELSVVLCRDESDTAGDTLHEVTKFESKYNLVVEKISECRFENKPDVIIDFSGCSTSLKLVDVCVKYGISLVICPTDFTEKELKYIENAAIEEKIGIMFAPTLTIGINVMMDYLEKISRVFSSFNFEIIEKHPCDKPKPTKTAMCISDVICRADIPISSVRLDGYVGVHEVVCADGFERITLTHESCSRQAFARGALFAAEYIRDRKGFYNLGKVVKSLLNEGEAF